MLLDLDYTPSKNLLSIGPHVALSDKHEQYHKSDAAVILKTMDSLGDILVGRGKKRDEPPEINIIKEYAFQAYKENVGVMVRDRDIVITCHSAALAGSLRMHVVALRKACQTTKRMVFRISD